MIGWAVRRLTIWGALGLLIYALVGHRLSPPNPTAASSGRARVRIYVLEALRTHELTWNRDPFFTVNAREDACTQGENCCR